MTDYKQHIANLIYTPLEQEELNQPVTLDTVLSAVTKTADDSFGDYAFPCFSLAKAMRMSPVAIAQKLANRIETDEIINKVEPVNGYLNFFIDRTKFVGETIYGITAADVAYGTSEEGHGKTICIDYSSVNICKSFHIGHLSTTAIGSSLYKLYKALGYNVVGINHLGDYGTQFGKMIVAYKLWGDKTAVERDGVAELQRLYVKFHQEEAEHPELTEQAREWFVKIERGDAEAQKLFEFFKKITLDDVKRIYKRLNVDFDSWNGESFFNDKMDAPLKMLEDKGLISESQGAKVVDLSAYDMPPCLLVKSDGSSLYATRDIAAAVWRKAEYDFDKCLYVVAYQQNLHFKQFFKVLELAGLPWAKDLVHVAYGMVSLEDGAMSTRKGNVVLLKDVIDKAVEKSREIISVKNPSLQNKEQVAEQVGVGAVLFSALENSKIKDITFTFDRVLNFDGETAPYLQYTHARCNSVLQKAGMSRLARIAHDMRALDNVETLRLCKLLAAFPQAVKDAAYKYEPSILSSLLIDIAQAFNKFYAEHRVLGEHLSVQNARLEVVSATQIVLKKGLALLGIDAPDVM
ncbi:MAG: arginine--tRNA ligase [Corallococcus sp.]|nr:arginine--tRNA ligase [Corallococcus sp.]MCM1359042.1 arginine--tRNA ligase [Corallococcus sp.]MCM1395031.1 arginine--tRNA ligase [Corallococcus sp.]